MTVGSTPESIRQSGPGELEIVWKDGHVSRYPVVHLRRSCRCASCVDEWSGEQILKVDQVPDDVKPLRIEPVGRYALHFDWSDGHSSGIYSFVLLRNVCPCAECRKPAAG
jgi:DUF971 family protein